MVRIWSKGISVMYKLTKHKRWFIITCNKMFSGFHTSYQLLPKPLNFCNVSLELKARQFLTLLFSNTFHPPQVNCISWISLNKWPLNPKMSMSSEVKRLTLVTSSLCLCNSRTLRICSSGMRHWNCCFFQTDHMTGWSTMFPAMADTSWCWEGSYSMSLLQSITPIFMHLANKDKIQVHTITLTQKESKINTNGRGRQLGKVGKKIYRIFNFNQE